MRTELPFRISGARPLGGLPPKMLVECTLDAAPPIPFSIYMNGRGLDDPCAGHSPKWLVFEERAAARRFVARFAETFSAPLPSRAPSDDAPLRLEIATCLLDRTDDVAHDRWNVSDQGEFECDYSLTGRRGTFSIRYPDEALATILDAFVAAFV